MDKPTLIKVRDTRGMCMNINPYKIEVVIPRTDRETGAPLFMITIGAQSKIYVSAEEYRCIRRHLNVIDPHDDPANYGEGEWNPDEEK